jgi:hypothetical protein
MKTTDHSPEVTSAVTRWQRGTESALRRRTSQSGPWYRAMSERLTRAAAQCEHKRFAVTLLDWAYFARQEWLISTEYADSRAAAGGAR